MSKAGRAPGRPPALSLTSGLNAVRKRMRQTTFARQQRVLRASQLVVNQMTGFTLSDYYLSTEVQTARLTYLNRRSKPLASAHLKRIAVASVVYVNFEETEEFVRRFLPRLQRPFILISGEMWSPSQPTGYLADEILASPLLLAWFSQNPEDDDLPIQGFPFGVALRSIGNVATAMRKSHDLPRSNSTLVPHAALHPHLPENVMALRQGLRPFMARPMRHQDYLMELARHRFVISPAGDRPETFRHWECIAMGAFPVSKVPRAFRKLFGDSMIYVDNLIEAARSPLTAHRDAPDRDLALVSHWRETLNQIRSGAD